jgi:hypothetical protein
MNSRSDGLVERTASRRGLQANHGVEQSLMQRFVNVSLSRVDRKVSKGPRVMPAGAGKCAELGDLHHDSGGN